jgi:site-specific DNA-methyltransferase (adenine-specific)
MINLMQGDCLELMKTIPSGSVDMILTDPPYGTTACKWDSVIPFEPMWEQLKRIIKPNGAIVLFGSEPFSSALRMSNIKQYKYDWVWEKSRPVGIFNAKLKPLRSHELISVFSDGMTANGSNRNMKYYPVGVCKGGVKTNNPKNGVEYSIKGYRESLPENHITHGSNYPRDVLKFSSESKTVHPTQKPVALLEYLIKTYTNEGEMVLDFTCGSGSTLVAAKNTNRHAIGIELDEKYFEIARERINAN